MVGFGRVGFENFVNLVGRVGPEKIFDESGLGPQRSD